MPSKSFTAFIFLLALTSFVNAECVIVPAIGLPTNPAANDAQQPSSSKPCGDISISQNLDSATPVTADASGNFKVSAINFNNGTGGSRHIQSMKANADGTGNNFASGEVTANGDNNPQSVGTQQLTAKLPDGIKCAGGPNKNLCIVAFETTAGYGNCVAVAQSQTAADDSTSTSEKKAQTGQNNGQAKTGQDGSKDGNGGQTTKNTNASQTNSGAKTGGNTQNHKKRMVRRRL